MSGEGSVRMRRISALLSDREWAAIQAIPRKERAGRMGVIIAGAYEAGQIEEVQPDG